MGQGLTRTGLLLGVLIGSACTISPAMERARPAGSFCPDEALRRDQVSPADTAGLRWYRAEEERDVRLGSAWCSTVGAPALEMHPRGRFPAWEGGTDLDVVAWNTAVGGGDIFAFLEQELELDCSGSSPMMAPGSRPFVLMLQEVWRRSDDLPRVLGGDSVPWTLGPDLSNDALDIVETAERCGLAYLYVPSSRNGPDDDRRPREDRGNAILTTLPFTAPIAFDLPHEGGRKVAVGLTSNSPGGERVRFVSTHFDVASTLLRTVITGNQTRARQALGLSDGIAEAEDDGPLTDVVLVGGDFNTWAGNESTLQIMRRDFPDSPEWDDRGTRGSFPADHIFFRRRAYTQFELAGYARIEDTYGSDHNGRRVTLIDRSLR